EDDPKVDSVGYGGIANALGTVSLDACVMDGKTLDCGGVCAVENVRHVAALARRGLGETPHVLLAGDGAQLFRVQPGIPLERLVAVKGGFPLGSLWRPEGVASWQKRKPHPARPEPPKKEPSDLPGHDTVNVLALDQKGNLAGACSTSGLAHKLPGRVGDSPLI